MLAQENLGCVLGSNLSFWRWKIQLHKTNKADEISFKTQRHDSWHCRDCGRGIDKNQGNGRFLRPKPSSLFDAKGGVRGSQKAFRLGAIFQIARNLTESLESPEVQKKRPQSSRKSEYFSSQVSPILKKQGKTTLLRIGFFLEKGAGARRVVLFFDENVLFSKCRCVSISCFVIWEAGKELIQTSGGFRFACPIPSCSALLAFRNGRLHHSSSQRENG